MGLYPGRRSALLGHQGDYRRCGSHGLFSLLLGVRLEGIAFGHHLFQLCRCVNEYVGMHPGGTEHGYRFQALDERL